MKLKNKEIELCREERKNEGKRGVQILKEEGHEGVFGGGEIRAEQTEGERERERDRKQVRATMSSARLHSSVNKMNQKAKHVARTLFHLMSSPASSSKFELKKGKVLHKRH